MATKKPKVETAMLRFNDIVDELTNPKGMTRGEYGDFLDEAIGELESRQACYREEEEPLDV